MLENDDMEDALTQDERVIEDEQKSLSSKQREFQNTAKSQFNTIAYIFSAFVNVKYEVNEHFFTMVLGYLFVIILVIAIRHLLTICKEKMLELYGEVIFDIIIELIDFIILILTYTISIACRNYFNLDLNDFPIIFAIFILLNLFSRILSKKLSSIKLKLS
jgi:hypothetical protein